MLKPFFNRDTGHKRGRNKEAVEKMARVAHHLRAHDFRATPSRYRRLGYLSSSRDYWEICGSPIGGQFVEIEFEPAAKLTS